jgi:hypothetical protein
MKHLYILILALALSGCGTSLRSRVSSFHKLPPEKTGITFAVLPFEWQNGSLEFQTYEERVISNLKDKGLEAVPLEQAQYVVFLAYAIDSGQNVSYSYPVFRQTGVSSANTSGTVNSYGNRATYSGTTTYTPIYGVVGSGVGTRTEYKRVVRLEILDKAALAAGNIRKVYEGEVVSSGSTGQLSAVMPTLLQALFQDFPGESGQSKNVTLPMQ